MVWKMLMVSANPVARNVATSNVHSDFLPGSSLHKRRHTQLLGRRNCYRCCRVFSSIGFTTDPRAGIERAASGLLKDATTLLVYQDVFRSPAAQAFLKVLISLRRGDDGMKVLDSYGEFFKLMFLGRYGSWEDFILEGILLGEGNPFVEACANASNPESCWYKQLPAALEAAAISDLECLQRLSITESTLSSWVAELVADVRPEWRHAAASSFSSKTKPASTLDQNSKGFGFMLDVLDSRNEGAAPANQQTPNEQISKEISVEQAGTPDSFVDEREKWRKKIGGHWKWSEAIPLLKTYYNQHGFGRAAASRVTCWKGGKFLEDLKFARKLHVSIPLSIHNKQYMELLENLKRHGAGFLAQHTIVVGPPGSGKSSLVKAALNIAVQEGVLHVVNFPTVEMKNLAIALEEMGKNCNIRFVLLIDDVLMKGGDENILKSALEESPANICFCLTKSETSNKGDVDNVSDVFGLHLALQQLDLDGYLSALEEIFEHTNNAKSNSYRKKYPEMRSMAAEWAKQRNCLSLRTVNQFLRTIC